VGIPTYGKPDSLFAIDSGWDLMYQIGRRHPEIGQVWLQRDVRTYRQEARSSIVRSALEKGATHLLMLDDDHVFTGADFSKLWNAMQEDPFRRPMIGALYFTRNDTPAPCIFQDTVRGTTPYFYYPEDQLMEVDVVGFGFQLFQTELFRRINEPRFDLGQGIGEDAAFCKRVRHAGGKVWCHTGVKIGHILETPRIVGEADYLALRQRAEENSHDYLETYSLVPTGEKQVVPCHRSGPAATARWWSPTSSYRRILGLIH
jgi:hypothetical protein